MSDPIEGIHESLAHPIRNRTDSLTSREKNIVQEVSGDRDGYTRKAEEAYRDGEYEKAVEHLDSAISKLENLKSNVDEDTAFYTLVYNEVENKDYYRAIVEITDEYNKNPCAFEALKSAKQKLENF